MIQDNGENGLNEFQLFHGTTANVADKICAENFDFRESGANGTVMGHGMYIILQYLNARKLVPS